MALGSLRPPPAFADCIDYSNSLRWVGGVYTEGSIGDVVVSGSYVFAANVVRGLQIIDISDPTALRIVGEAPIAPGAEGVAVAGGRAYVAASSSGLQVVDVSDPSSPDILGSVVTTDAFAVAVRGDRAYLADRDDGFLVIDVSDPSSPRVARVVPIPGGRPVDLALAGDFALVAALDAGIAVIDISTPDAAFVAGGLVTPGSAHGVAIEGDFAYVGDGDAGVQVLDISTPTVPRIVGNAPARRLASGIAVAGSYVFFGDESAGMEVVDVADPTAPRIVGSAKTGSYTFDVAIDGNHAYAACWGSGVQVIDITVPTSPMPVGTIPTAETVYDVVVRDNIAYLACDVAGLEIIDVSIPDAPRLVGTMDTPGNARGIVVLGDYAYIADAWYGLHIVDVSDPAHPVIVGTAQARWTTQAVAVHGYLAYLATQDGLLVLDVIDPTSPEPLYDLPPYTYINDVVVSGDKLYVATIGGELYVRDFGSWGGPQVILDGYISRVTVAGDLAFVVGGFPGVAVVDVSDPDAVFLAGIGGFRDPGAWDVVGSGDFAYVSTWSWLEVVDVSDPSHPTEVGATTEGGGGFAVALTDDYVYLGEYESFSVDLLHCPEDPTPVLLAPIASPREGGILISWTIPEGVRLTGVRVERRVMGDGSGWEIVSPLMPATPLHGEYLDEDIEPTILYDYVVEAFGPGGSVGRFGPVTAAAIVPSAIAVHVWPNPGRGLMDLSLAVPRSGDGLLRVYDVQGREIARKNLMGLRAGVHRHSWDVRDQAGSNLATGTYYLRFDASAGHATSRWFVIR